MECVKRLARFIQDYPIERYVYVSETQDHAAPFSPMDFRICFTKLEISPWTNIVTLSGEQGMMCFGGIRDIRVDKEASLLGAVIVIECDAIDTPEGMVAYSMTGFYRDEKAA